MKTKNPKFDIDGDITDESFELIKNWSEDWDEFFTFIEECFNLNYGRIIKYHSEINIITGGWSCNENVIRAMKENKLFMALSWESSHRGGRYIFKKIKGIKNV